MNVQRECKVRSWGATEGSICWCYKVDGVQIDCKSTRCISKCTELYIIKINIFYTSHCLSGALFINLYKYLFKSFSLQKHFFFFSTAFFLKCIALCYIDDRAVLLRTGGLWGRVVFDETIALRLWQDCKPVTLFIRLLSSLEQLQYGFCKYWQLFLLRVYT